MRSAATSSSGQAGLWRLLALTPQLSAESLAEISQMGGPATQTLGHGPLSLGCAKSRGGDWDQGDPGDLEQSGTLGMKFQAPD